MGSVNRVLLVGNLGQAPEMRQTAGGTAVCNLRVATNESYKDKSGQRQERVEWHTVVVFGASAENCAKYLAKGRTVGVEGRLQTRSWEKDGTKKSATEIIADRVIFLGSNGPKGREPGEDDLGPPGEASGVESNF